MPKKSKLKTLDWVLEGYESEAEYNKARGIKKSKQGKVFKLRKCPECNSDDVKVVITGEEGKAGKWECKKCKWQGADVQEEELLEEEFMAYLDKKGEEVL